MLMDADACGTGLPVSENRSANRLRSTFAAMKAENVPFTIKDLTIGGHDLIQAGVPKEKRNEIMHTLLKLCADKNCPYLTREAQLKYIKDG